MVEVLMQLLDQGEYEKCLKAAEQQLFKGGYTIAQLAQINMVICRCRVALNDPYSAVPSGLLASKLARDVGDWDTLGRTLLSLGTALVGVRQFDQALHHLYSFFEHLLHYKESRRLEGAIWKSIGVAHQRKLESGRALEAFTRARDWFSKNGMDRSAFSVTHDMLNTHLQLIETDENASVLPVADLLAFERAMVKKHATESYYASTHYLDRANVYFMEGRIGRAIICAMKSMEVLKNDHLVNFHGHMVLHKCTKALGNAKQALGYALAARVAALQAKHFDLEFIASQAMAEVIRKQGLEVVRELDEEYRSMGIDLAQYISPALLGRPN